MRQNKINVLLKKYPRYKLYARIYEKDLNKFKRTKDPSLILYKFCENEVSNPTPNYKEIWATKRRKDHIDYLKLRKSIGFKTT